MPTRMGMGFSVCRRSHVLAVCTWGVIVLQDTATCCIKKQGRTPCVACVMLSVSHMCRCVTLWIAQAAVVVCQDIGRSRHIGYDQLFPTRTLVDAESSSCRVHTVWSDCGVTPRERQGSACRLYLYHPLCVPTSCILFAS